MAFLTEPEPERGAKLPIMPGISRIVANNPGPMTYYGTNTYLIETEQGTVILDPGPEDHPEHVEATGARTAGFKTSGLDSFNADIKLSNGETIAGMAAVHTPGHALDHLCFSVPGQNGDKVLFSADHVMSWSTSVVSPPGGDMKDYFNSLEVLLRRDDDVYLPGHGPALREPRDLVRAMLAHRVMREHAIAEKLKEGAASTYTLMDTLYSQVNPRLRRAAERNVLAHLLKMEIEGKVTRDGENWRAA
jgi:glyoxylase-like metal-dependent hydrolase (beta-lactamase superfamily II)